MNINRQLALSIFWVVLGVVLIVLAVAEIIDSNYFAGMGGGFVVIGIFRTIRWLKYQNDEEYKKKVEIETSDERSSFLRMKSWAIVGYITVLVQALASVVAYILKQKMISQVLCCSICFILTIYCLVYVILNKKY